MSLPPIPSVGPALLPRNDHLEIAPYAPGEAEEKSVVRVVEMTPTITHRAKLPAHSPEPGVRALADKKMPGAIAQHLGNGGEVALNLRSRCSMCAHWDLPEDNRLVRLLGGGRPK